MTSLPVVEKQVVKFFYIYCRTYFHASLRINEYWWRLSFICAPGSESSNNFYFRICFFLIAYARRKISKKNQGFFEKS